MKYYRELIFDWALSLLTNVEINTDSDFVAEFENDFVYVNISKQVSDWNVLLKAHGDTVLLQKTKLHNSIVIQNIFSEELEDWYNLVSGMKNVLRILNVYVICPVRGVTEEEDLYMKEFVDIAESAHKGLPYLDGQEITDFENIFANDLNGYKVKCHFPPRDVNQDDPTGYDICHSHLYAMEKAKEVWVFWNSSSKGSHFDLGMAFALQKPLRLIKCFDADGSQKSYVKVMEEIIKRQ